MLYRAAAEKALALPGLKNSNIKEGMK